MKRKGFGNWERAVDESIEQLRMLRIFRKPQASRTFARMLMKVLNNCVCLRYTISLKRYVLSQECFHFLPPFYALAFAQLAHGSNSIGLGISFAIIISLGLSGRSCFQISCPALE